MQNQLKMQQSAPWKCWFVVPGVMRPPPPADSEAGVQTFMNSLKMVKNRHL